MERNTLNYSSCSSGYINKTRDIAMETVNLDFRVARNAYMDFNLLFGVRV